MPSSLTHTHTHKHTNTRIPPPVSVGEGYYLMESCFFFFRSYRPFHRHPACPARKTMRAQSLLLGRVPSISTSAAHPSPKKTTHAAFAPPQCYLDVVSLPPPPLLVLTPACPPRFWQHVHDARLFFPVISSARSRCARDYCKMKVWGGRGGGREREERRNEVGDQK